MLRSPEVTPDGTLIPPPHISFTTSDSFHPHARGETDTVLCSLDATLFHVNSNHMNDVSKLAFQSLICNTHAEVTRMMDFPVVLIPELSQTVDVMLHVLNNMDFTDNIPSFDTFIGGLMTMYVYNISIASLLVPSNPCYDHFLSFAAAHPLEVYSYAAYFDIHSLAVKTSSHLLSQSLVEITPEMIELMGSVYFKKLCMLHLIRLAEQKKVLRAPPYPHAPTPDCSFDQQKPLARAWTMTAGYLVWEDKCDLSTSMIQSTFGTLEPYLDCEDCREMLRRRVQDVIECWVQVQRTID